MIQIKGKSFIFIMWKFDVDSFFSFRAVRVRRKCTHFFAFRDLSKFDLQIEFILSSLPSPPKPDHFPLFGVIFFYTGLKWFKK